MVRGSSTYLAGSVEEARWSGEPRNLVLMCRAALLPQARWAWAKASFLSWHH